MLLNAGIRTKLLAGYSVVILLALAIGAIGIAELRSVNAIGATMYADRVVPLRDLGEARSVLGDIDSQIQRAITDGSAARRPEYTTVSEKDAVAIDKLIKDYEATYLVDDEKRGLTTFHTDWTQYQVAFRAVLKAANSGDPAAATAKYFEAAAPLYAKVDTDLAQLVKVNDTIASDLNDDIRDAYTRGMQLITGMLLVATVVAVSIGLLIARSIAGAAREMAAVARSLAQGDVEQTITVRSGDELGQMADAFRQMIAYQREMSTTAVTLASGDLSVAVQPASARDGLGNAFLGMVDNLRDLIGEVTASAQHLTETSHRLGGAASESSDAVRQVAVAVQSLAAQAGESLESANHSQEAIGHLGSAIDSIAQGASEQAQQVQQVVDTSHRMMARVEDMVGSAREAMNASRVTRETAEQGSRAVDQTVAGMRDIRHVVDTVASKVDELGVLGGQIGSVVETIDEIADQTNLLALNAAIEAARAGEHGRGFAIVADEVRKLAERSQRETKAIGDLIARVQRSTSEAVQAMNQGAERVDIGAARADEAGTSLREIVKAVDIAVGQVTRIVGDAEGMETDFRTVVGAMSGIGAVVEENSAATEEMAAQAQVMHSAIQNITHASTQNSVATEEVSASAEEMSAQIDTMSEQAGEASEMATHLLGLVSRFTLDGKSQQARSAGSGPRPAVRRRSA